MIFESLKKPPHASQIAGRLLRDPRKYIKGSLFLLKFKYVDQDPVVKKASPVSRGGFLRICFFLKRSVPKQTALISN